MKTVIGSHVYELMPETKDQFCAMPSIVIELEKDRYYTLPTFIRKKTRPLRVKNDFSFDLHAIETEIIRFKELANRFQHSDI